MTQETGIVRGGRVHLWGLAIALLVTSVLLVLAIFQMWPAAPNTPEEDFFIAVDSSQVGGVLRLKVDASDPLDLVNDETVELLISIESTAKNSPANLTLGGAGATQLVSCNGTGVFIDPRTESISFGELPPTTSDLLLEYFGRPTGTGRLNSGSRNPVTSEDAREVAEAQSYRRSVALPMSESVFEFIPNEQAPVEYAVWRAELTCIFNIEAFVGRSGSVSVLRVPDLLISTTDQAGDGLIHASYRLRLANDVGLNLATSTFTSSRQYVDPVTERQLLEMSGEWWAQNHSGEEAVSYAGGHAQFEPKDSTTNRVHAQLAAGFLASLLLTLLVTIIGTVFVRVERRNNAH